MPGCDRARDRRPAKSAARLDLLESLSNAAIGLFVSWSATFFVLGYSAGEGIAITAMFFLLSFARSWGVRRFFRIFANV